MHFTVGGQIDLQARGLALYGGTVHRYIEVHTLGVIRGEHEAGQECHTKWPERAAHVRGEMGKCSSIEVNVSRTFDFSWNVNYLFGSN